MDPHTGDGSTIVSADTLPPRGEDGAGDPSNKPRTKHKVIAVVWCYVDIFYSLVGLVP